MVEADITFMKRCIALAKQGAHQVSPNPLVGSLVVKNRQIIGLGWHQRCGEAHAEINALKQAGAAARGADLYVSLEPCCHQGKTGPCSEALIKAGISRVVYGMLDPNPLVSGKGIEQLKEAGIEVEGPVLEAECVELNLGFIKRVSKGLPYLRCKLAMSLDGRTAMASGESKWITGAQSREDVQSLRASSDAILTGIGTILHDDPSLNVRIGDVSPPLRVIIDSQLKIPKEAKILNLPGSVLVATCQPDRSDFSNESIQVKQFLGSNNRVGLRAVLEYLAQERQCNDVLLEAGSILSGAMLLAGLVDEFIIYAAPDLLGNDAMPLLTLPGMEKMQDKVHLEFLSVELLGKDCKMRCRVMKDQH